MLNPWHLCLALGGFRTWGKGVWLVPSRTQAQLSGTHTGGGGGLVAQSCPTLVTPWTVACQAPLSVGFSRQEYWSGLPPHGQSQSQKKENILDPFSKGGATKSRGKRHL